MAVIPRPEGNIEPLACTPIVLPAIKVVYSPHVYGPDVSGQPYFNDGTFPANMPAIWEQHFGRFAGDYTVIIGEFGGRYGHGGDSHTNSNRDQHRGQQRGVPVRLSR